MLLLYLALLIPAMYWVVKTLAPEMVKAPKTPEPDLSGISSSEIQNKIKRLENILNDKNKDINFLQAELKIFYTQTREFDKVKSLLEEEIHRLREQNRIFRSELGLPTTQSKAGLVK